MMTPLGSSAASTYLARSHVLTGLMGVVLGAVLLARPQIALPIVAILFGCYFVASTVPQVVLALAARASLVLGIFLIVSAAFAVAFAVVAILRLDEPLPLIAIGVGTVLAARGISTALLTADGGGLPGRRWSITVGAAALVAGLIALGWPVGDGGVAVRVGATCVLGLGLLETAAALGIHRGRTRRARTAEEVATGAPATMAVVDGPVDAPLVNASKDGAPADAEPSETETDAPVQSR
jgi:uncharacterized membrane protein HdeD (DUF308 family)